MGFQFGLMSSIPAGLGTISYIAVVLFLIAFEHFTEILDELEEEYNSAFHMIQTVYKELMIMGVVSFIIIMLETNKTLGSESVVHWLEAIDFAHISLFFAALFFVIHAIFLIILSISLGKEYRRLNVVSVHDIIKKLVNLRDLIQDSTGFSRFYNKYISSIPLRNEVEFKVQYHLFKDAYCLPISFDFALYLKLCTEKYILQLLKIGIFNRFLLAVFALINYIRIVIMARTQHSHCLEKQDTLHRYLSGSVGLEFEDECVEFMLRTFTILGFVLILWSIALVLVTRYYEIRLNSHQQDFFTENDYVHIKGEYEITTEIEDIRLSIFDHVDAKSDNTTNINDTLLNIFTLLKNEDHNTEYISKKDFSKIIEILDLQLSIIKIDIIFEAIDIDKSGFIRFENFRDFVLGPNKDKFDFNHIGFSTLELSDLREEVTEIRRKKSNSSVLPNTNITTTNNNNTNTNTNTTNTNKIIRPRNSKIIITELDIYEKFLIVKNNYDEILLANQQELLEKGISNVNMNKTNSFIQDSSGKYEKDHHRTLRTMKQNIENLRREQQQHKEEIGYIIMKFLLSIPDKIYLYFITNCYLFCHHHNSNQRQSPAQKRTTILELKPVSSQNNHNGHNHNGPGSFSSPTKSNTPRRTSTQSNNNNNDNNNNDIIHKNSSNFSNNSNHHDNSSNDASLANQSQTQTHRLLTTQSLSSDKNIGNIENIGNTAIENDPTITITPETNKRNEFRASKSIFAASVNDKGNKSVSKVNSTIFGDDIPGFDNDNDLNSQDSHGNGNSKRTDRFSDIYFLGNETLFRTIIETTVLFNCVWLSFWATNYITLANVSENTVQWQLLMIVPVIIVMPILGLVVKTSARLVAITSLDLDVFAKVVETQEDILLLVEELKMKILEQISELTFVKPKKEIIEDLFAEIDLDHSNEITKVEFRHMLRILDLNYSNTKLNHLFNAIDISKDGNISVEEFTNLVIGDENENDNVNNNEDNGNGIGNGITIGNGNSVSINNQMIAMKKNFMNQKSMQSVKRLNQKSNSRAMSGLSAIDILESLDE